jgi:hypothetical protein
VPIGADDEIQRIRSVAVASWFADIERRRHTPVHAPATELVDEAVVKVNGRVAIAQSWRVWGPVRAV